MPIDPTQYLSRRRRLAVLRSDVVPTPSMAHGPTSRTVLVGQSDTRTNRIRQTCAASSGAALRTAFRRDRGAITIDTAINIGLYAFVVSPYVSRRSGRYFTGASTISSCVISYGDIELRHSADLPGPFTVLSGIYREVTRSLHSGSFRRAN